VKDKSFPSSITIFSIMVDLFKDFGHYYPKEKQKMHAMSTKNGQQLLLG